MSDKRYDNHEDAFDERGLLRDGKRVRVPLMLRDAMRPLQHIVAEDAVARGFGLRHAFELHQPGPRFCTDRAALEAKAEAYRQMVADMCNAWRNPPPAAAAPPPHRDAVPARPVYDAAEGRRIKQEAYDRMVTEMCDAWKGPVR